MKNKEEMIRLSERHYTSFDLEKIGKKVIFRHPSLSPDIGEQRQRLFSDNKVRQNILQTLYRSSLLDASRIEVLVNKGKVILKGSVKNSQEKNYATQVIQFVPGIIEIFNDLIVTDHQFH